MIFMHAQGKEISKFRATLWGKDSMAIEHIPVHCTGRAYGQANTNMSSPPCNVSYYKRRVLNHKRRLHRGKGCPRRNQRNKKCTGNKFSMK
jgi:hypothetical protein